MAYQTIHTRAGLIALAEAEATGTPINLTHMAVGDGNGNAVEPSIDQTQLARERFRAPVNRVTQNPDDPRRFTAELIIPASEGGWTLREIGVFDADGTLFAVGNLPEAYKPTADEGAFSDAVVRLEFAVANAEVITLQLDPNVAVASQAWVINNLTPAFLLPGGTTGQQLVKKSNADGDTEWKSPEAINVTVDTIAEKQQLAASQTQVDLSVTTTYGLAVYIDGLRIDRGSAAGEWQPDGNLSTRLHLGQSYAAGTRITLVNNEPAGSAPAPLERSKNLADVQSAATSRDNLDVFSRAQTRQMAPAGLVAHFARTSAPAGWLKANGAQVSRTAYADLFAAIGTTFGNGDGFNTFNLPDLRGEFIRSADDGRGIDPGRSMGSSQGDQTRAHSHGGKALSGGYHSHSGNAKSTALRFQYYAGGSNVVVDAEAGSGPAATVRRSGTGYTNTVSHYHDLAINAGGSHEHTLQIYNAGGNETRPRNVVLLACIKF